jgi:hypothetical protein
MRNIFTPFRQCRCAYTLYCGQRPRPRAGILELMCSRSDRLLCASVPSDMCALYCPHTQTAECHTSCLSNSDLSVGLLLIFAHLQRHYNVHCCGTACCYVFLTHCFDVFNTLKDNNAKIVTLEFSIYLTSYGLNGSGIESRWEREFPHPSSSALGSTQLAIK